MKLGMVATIWQGSNTSSQAGQAIRNLNHARVTLNLIDSDPRVGLTSSYHWTRSTIFDPYIYPLQPYCTLANDASESSISGALDRAPSIKLGKQTQIDSRQQCLTTYNALIQEMIAISRPGSYGAPFLREQYIGEHSIDGCFYMATRFIGSTKYNNSDLAKWPVDESDAKYFRRGQAKRPLSEIAPDEVNYRFNSTSEYSATALINALRALGFRTLNLSAD